MCTTGFLRLGPDDYLLFKNKDFGRDRFDDRIVLEKGVFGAAGVTTWADGDPALDRFSGFSIGANSSGLLACDSNVRTLEGLANYDDLVEAALREGSDVAEGAAAVQAAAAARPYLWGNLMLIDGRRQAAVEVRGSETAVLRPDGPAARTNHHIELGVHPGNDDTETSEDRLASAQRRLDRAESMEDVFELLRSHDQGGTGVCSHAAYTTVYSYVLRRRAGVTELTVSRGRPCRGSPRPALEIPLGERWSPEAADAFLSAYPSERTPLAPLPLG